MGEHNPMEGSIYRNLDFTNGDHSWRNYFRTMWKCGYLQTFLVFLLGDIISIFSPDIFEGDSYMRFILIVLFGVCTGVVAVFGLFLSWRDLKSGKI